MPTRRPAGPIRLSVLGLPVAVRFDQAPPGTPEAFAHAWEWTLDTGSSAADPVVVDAPASPDVATAMHRLSAMVTLAAIDAAAGSTWMLHAAGLAAPDGATLALVAPSGTGKTTASRTLGRRLGYLTDETVGITYDGAVLPYPKPLSLVRPGTPIKAQVSPADAGLVRPPAGARLHAVVVLDRDGARRPWLDPVRSAAALPVLAEQTSHLTRLARPLGFMADVLGRTVGVHRLHYGEISQVAPLLEGLLEGRRP